MIQPIVSLGIRSVFAIFVYRAVDSGHMQNDVMRAVLHPSRIKVVAKTLQKIDDILTSIALIVPNLVHKDLSQKRRYFWVQDKEPRAAPFVSKV